jgi:hypothetical protein
VNALEGMRVRHSEACSLVDRNGHLYEPRNRMKAMFASLDDIPGLLALIDVAVKFYWVEDEFSYRPLGYWPGKDALQRGLQAATEALMAAIAPLLEETG